MYDTNKDLEFTPPIAEYDSHDYETEPRKPKTIGSVNSSANKKKKKRMRWLLSLGVVPIMILAGAKIAPASNEFGGEFPLNINGTEITLPCTVAEMTDVLEEKGYYIEEFAPYAGWNNEITARVSVGMSKYAILDDPTLIEGLETVLDVMTVRAANLTGADIPYSEWLCYGLDFTPGHLYTEQIETINDLTRNYAITYTPYPDITYQGMNPLDCASIGDLQKQLGAESKLINEGADSSRRFIWHLDNNPYVVIYGDEYDNELLSTTFIVTTP